MYYIKRVVIYNKFNNIKVLARRRSPFQKTLLLVLTSCKREIKVDIEARLRCL